MEKGGQEAGELLRRGAFLKPLGMGIGAADFVEKRGADRFLKNIQDAWVVWL